MSSGFRTMTSSRDGLCTKMCCSATTRPPAVRHVVTSTRQPSSLLPLDSARSATFFVLITVDRSRHLPLINFIHPHPLSFTFICYTVIHFTLISLLDVRPGQRVLFILLYGKDTSRVLICS